MIDFKLLYKILIERTAYIQKLLKISRNNNLTTKISSVDLPTCYYYYTKYAILCNKGKCIKECLRNWYVQK